MRNYKALKAASKVSVRKQEAAATVYNDDGSVKTKSVQE